MSDVAGYWKRLLHREPSDRVSGRNLSWTPSYAPIVPRQEPDADADDWLPPLKEGEWVFERQMTRADLGLPDFPPMPPMPDVAYAFWLGKDGRL